MNLMRSATPIPFLTVLLALTSTIFAGCGGGGGGSSIAQASLTYTTDWTNRTRSGVPTGLSQRVQITRLDGTVVDSQIVNADQPGKQSVKFATLTSGNYLLTVQLNSLRDFQGLTTGTTQAFFTAGSTPQIDTSVGDDVASIQVSPANSTLTIGQTVQLYASALTADSRLTFTQSTDFSWSTLGSGISVNGTGVVTGTSQGAGSVRATHTPSAKLGSAQVTCQSFSATRGKWTVMVFLNSANDLEYWSAVNVNQMERVAGNPNVRFVVQWKKWLPQNLNATDFPFNGTRRYLLKSDQTNLINSELVSDLGQGVDMGSPTTLRNFIDWTKSRYPADHYALVVWDHGKGWQRAAGAINRSISTDDEFGSIIDTWDLSSALGATHLDILSYDACLMQQVEVAAEVQDQVDYIACSEENTPAQGYPYDSVFTAMMQSPDATPRQLSKGFVDGMVNYPWPGNTEITQSVVDAKKVAALETAVDQLAGSLIANQTDPLEISLVRGIRQNARRYARNDAFESRYYDLYDIADRIVRGTSILDLSAAAANVKTAVLNSIVWNGQKNSPDSHGIAIDFSASTDPISNYEKLRFAQTTRWMNWLKVAP